MSGSKPNEVFVMLVINVLEWKWFIDSLHLIVLDFFHFYTPHGYMTVKHAQFLQCLSLL